eukprot:TRINITY_DN3373_c0_g1_i3.p1 TRINITY_DN3373_c0_g1~~TRINITY_DN3373_c0_g1_i3.p1  ORF type:complete len:299 (+),score=41.59 TRINITY_DN3373_c0_g1_i3:91-987(+)
MAVRCLPFGLRTPRSRYVVPLFASASRSSSGIVEDGKLKGIRADPEETSSRNTYAGHAVTSDIAAAQGEESGIRADPEETSSRNTYAGHAVTSDIRADPEETSSRNTYGHAVTSDIASAQGEESGSDQLVDFGKHRDRSYSEIVKDDPEYCRWVLDKARKDPENVGPALEAFAAYLEGVQLPQGSKYSRGGSGKSGGYAARRESGGWSGSSSYGGGAGAGGGTQDRPGKAKLGILAEGSWPVMFGKYRGFTFAEVFARDPRYCEWLVNRILVTQEEVSAEQLALTVFVMHRASSPPAE